MGRLSAARSVRLSIPHLIVALVAASTSIAMAAIPAHATSGGTSSTTTTPQNLTVEAPDPAPGLSIDKRTNGGDQPQIRVGEPVTWTYVITNTGNTPLVDVGVVDEVGGPYDGTDGRPISCDEAPNGALTLAPGASAHCSAASIAWYGGYRRGHVIHENRAVASGTYEGTTVTATDESSYVPSVACPFRPDDGDVLIDFFSNDPAGAGGFMMWSGTHQPPSLPSEVGPIDVSIPTGTYRIALASYDDHLGRVATLPSDQLVQPEEVWRLGLTTGGTSTADVTWWSSVTGDVPDAPDPANWWVGVVDDMVTFHDGYTTAFADHAATSTDHDSVHAVCALLERVAPPTPSISIVKDGDQTVLTGTSAEFTITVTNDGNVPLTDVSVVDPVTPSCDFAAGADARSPAGPFDGTLAPGASVSYRCSTDPLVVGFVNTATVSARHGDHIVGPVSDTATVKVVPALQGGELGITKLVDDLAGGFVDLATYPPGIATATWQITVRNTSPSTLTAIRLSDEGAPACEEALTLALDDVGWVGPDGPYLPPGADVTFTCDGAIPVGADAANLASVTATDPYGRTVGPVDDDAAIQRVAASATIGDTVWADENANGVQDAGERGLPEALVRLAMPDGSSIETHTNADGKYLFSALLPGSYTVDVVLSSIPNPQSGDLLLTTPGSFSVALGEGQRYLDADFGVAATLPKTGIETGDIGIAGIVLVLLGSLGVVSTRRRTARDAP